MRARCFKAAGPEVNPKARSNVSRQMGPGMSRFPLGMPSLSRKGFGNRNKLVDGTFFTCGPMTPKRKPSHLVEWMKGSFGDC